MKRIVPIIVTDDEVAELVVAQRYKPGVRGFSSAIHPAPPDDQLTRDLDATCTILDAVAEFVGDVPTALVPDDLSIEDMNAVARRLRAAFHLDEDDA